MTMTPSVSIEAILMSFLMKLSTDRQQNLWARNRRVAYMANYDKLTNAKNYTAYQKEIFNYFGVARTSRRPLVIAMLDIDHFKLVNDRYGHLAGNQILSGVAEELKNTLAQYSDSYELYRTGGEEFTLVFPDTTMSEAYQVITNCWRAVRELSVHYGKNDIKITISIGATEMVAADQLPNDVYQRADDSLYVNKEHGRDAVTIDGQTQQLLDESEHEKYAYFIKGIYDLKGDDQRRNANDLVLQRYEQKTQTWVNPGEAHVSIEKRIDLLRDAVVNSRNQFIVISLSIASFLNKDLADEIIGFFKGPNGPEQIYIELKQVPAMDLLVKMADYYHQNGVFVIISQIGKIRHYEKVHAILKYIDGIKLTINDEDENQDIPGQVRQDVKFWGGVTERSGITFVVDGITNDRMLGWLKKQDYVDYVEGDYLSKLELPLLNS